MVDQNDHEYQVVAGISTLSETVQMKLILNDLFQKSEQTNHLGFTVEIDHYNSKVCIKFTKPAISLWWIGCN